MSVEQMTSDCVTIPYEDYARAIDSLADLAVEIAELREENDRFVIKLNAEHIVRQNAEAENAKLQELVSDMDRWLRKEMDCNRELRELVRDMFRDFANADAELKQRHGRTFMARRYEPRMHELGIEEE